MVRHQWKYQQVNCHISSVIAHNLLWLKVFHLAIKFPVISGVVQGPVLGPCLLLYYINDIAEQLSSTTRLFADDIMIYMAVRSRRDAELLQADLEKLT